MTEEVGGKSKEVVGLDLEDIDESTGYKPPAQKTLEEIVSADQEDESLQRYKKALLGEAALAAAAVAAGDSSVAVVVFPDDPRQVIVKRLTLLVEGRPDRHIDLTTNLEAIAKTKFVLKEGVQYKIRIEFYVQRDIVTGLKYIQKTTRMGVTVDKMTFMVGSYPPKDTVHTYVTPVEEAPAGMTGRGSYHVHSLFSDDDKKEHLKWDWHIEVKKDWGDDD